ncbi:MAG: LppM family (lipo)protein [Actinophytocola sp.]|uniref:LppM family (lipo)protein n=1 Tax=Actinophytocola sp. TaxID=1872138 RepID=UPI003D6B7E2C
MRTAGRDHVRRLFGLIVLFGVLVVTLSGCVRIHAALAVSSDDLISGEIVVAALPASKDDNGPSLTVPPELAEKVRTEPYTADGYVGQKVTLTGLRFNDLPLLVDSIANQQQYRLSFRRSGELVTLAGSIDLTRVPPERADVQVKIAFPGRISRTNGDNTDGTISWEPKPEAVTEFSAVAQYSDKSGVSWTQWVVMVGGGAVGVAVLVVLLALFTHRRSLKLERAQARRAAAGY